MSGESERSTASKEPAARELARAPALEQAPTLGGLSNLAAQQQARAGVGLVGGPPLDNQATQAAARASQPLPHRDQIQASFGHHDVSGVRTTTDGAANEALGSRAFAAGGRIAFGEAPDAWLAAHEAAHVVQQRAGASRPRGSEGDPWEQHADRVADAVAERRDAAPLLDEVTRGGGDRPPAIQLATGHADNAPEHFHATSGDKSGSKYFGSSNALDWMKHWGDLLVTRLDSYLAATEFAMPSPYATWIGSTADFAHAMFAPAVAAGKAHDTLARLVAPDDLDRLINAGRDARTVGPIDPVSEEHTDAKGEIWWSDAVVAEVGKILIKRIIESLARELPRWVSARNQLALSALGPAKTADRDPAPKEILASHPIDTYVVTGLKGHVAVDLAQYRKANPGEAVLGDMHLGEVHRVSYKWLHADGAYNWIRVDDPTASVEDVALTLYGDSTYAHTITGAPPFFGIADIPNLSDAATTAYLTAAKTAPPPIEGDDDLLTAPEQQVQKPSQLSDDILLAQASAAKNVKGSGILPDEEGRKVLIDRMAAGLGTFQMIQKASQKLPRGGYDNLLTAAYQRLQARALKVADRANAMSYIVGWDRQTIAQNDLLESALNGIRVAVATYEAFSSWDTSKLVVQHLGWMYLKVGSLSEQAISGQQALAAANDQSKLFPVTVMELVLAEVRKTLHTEDGSKWGASDEDHDQRTELKKHRATEAKLRLLLARVRDELLQDQKKAAADLKAIQIELTDLQNEVALVADLDQIEAAWQALFKDLSYVGVVTGANTDDSELMSGKKGHDAKSNPALLDLFSEWSAIYREYRFGDKSVAVARLKERRPVLQALLQKIEPLIKSNESKNRWVTFAVLIGITVITAGVGAYVEGAAGAAWGVGSWGAFAATTGAEAFTFTTLSYGFVEKDPTIGGYFMELGKSLLMFGALKGISNKYIAFVGKESAGVLDTMLVQFAATNLAALGEADLKKYLATKQHLSFDEALEITKQNALMTIASALATAAARPGLESLKLQGTADSALARLRSSKAELNKLAIGLESGKSASPKQIEALLAKQREVLAAQHEALQSLEKIAGDPKAAKQAGFDEALLAKLEAARTEHLGSVRELEMATALQLTEGGGPVRHAEQGKKWQTVVDFWKGQDGATVTELHPDAELGAKGVEITTKDGDTFRLMERTASDAKAVSQTSHELPGTTAVDASGLPAGGTNSAAAYTLSDTPVQNGKSVAAVARNLAPDLANEGIALDAVKAGGGGGMKAGGTLSVGDIKAPVSIEVASEVAKSGASTHGDQAGHASVKVVPDGKGGWRVEIRIDERLATEGDVASHLRHELREAAELLGELQKDPTFYIEAGQKASSLEDPAKATPHDRAAAKELRDLVDELGGSIEAGKAARARVAGAYGKGNAADRALVARGENAQARLDALLDSMGLNAPGARETKIGTVLELAGEEPGGPLADVLEGYGARSDTAAAHEQVLKGLDPAARTAVDAALGNYADTVPPGSMSAVADAVANGGGAKVQELVAARAAGTIDDVVLADALDQAAQDAIATTAETNEAGGKRLYKLTDPQGKTIGPEGLSPEQDAAFRERIKAGEERDARIEAAKEANEEPTEADLKAEGGQDARYERYKAKLANAASELKPGEPWSRQVWDQRNPQRATAEGRKVEKAALAKFGAKNNNAAGDYQETDYYDKKTNKLVTTRPDGFFGDTPVESKYVEPGSKEQTVFDTTQTRAQRSMKKGHIMLLSTKVEPGKPPTNLKPSGPLAKDSEVYFYDPGQDAITHRWNKDASTWDPYP